tara:strand:+ start:30 stop:614 length:585 start_codon:yes stop_codon:yes gene_type:complete
MFYGDLHFIDILLFAGVAAFLFYRLRNVLGKRTGFENKKNHNNIEVLPKEEKNTKEDIELDKNFEELQTAYKHIPGFDHYIFLQGAKNAFETIVGMFNSNNKSGLKKLVNKNVYKNFCDAIDSRDQNTSPKEILSLNIESIKKVWLEGSKIFVTVLYTSKQIDPNGENEITKKDMWTFEKNISTSDPSWMLSAT